jgi:HK97 family phage portal protein
MLLRTFQGPVERAATFTLPGRGLGTQPLTGPLSITESTTLSIPAAYRCVQIISDTAASLPLHAYRGKTQLNRTPDILRQPDPTDTRMSTLAAVFTSLLIDGNAYLLVGNRDSLGFPRSFVVLAPGAVALTVRNGVRVYSVAGQSYDAEDVLHIRGMTLPGHDVGLGPLAMQRRALGLAIAGEDHAAELYVNGAIPAGILSSEQELTQAEADAAKASFIAAHGGRQRSPAVLSGGMDYKTLSFSAADLELVESRRFSAQQICTIFGVPSWIVGVGSTDSRTYSNVQDDNRAFVSWTLRPHLSRVEQSLSTLLPRGQEAKFNLDALLRADTLARYSAHSAGLAGGWLSVAEIRALEDLDIEEDLQ